MILGEGILRFFLNGEPHPLQIGDNREIVTIYGHFLKNLPFSEPFSQFKPN